jgi:hypothetical protein
MQHVTRAYLEVFSDVDGRGCIELMVIEMQRAQRAVGLSHKARVTSPSSGVNSLSQRRLHVVPTGGLPSLRRQ